MINHISHDMLSVWFCDKWFLGRWFFYKVINFWFSAQDYTFFYRNRFNTILNFKKISTFTPIIVWTKHVQNICQYYAVIQMIIEIPVTHLKEVRNRKWSNLNICFATHSIFEWFQRTEITNGKFVRCIMTCASKARFISI